jgi:hypothetical protein
MTPTVSSPLWPVPITTVGRSRGGTVVFMRGGKLHVTCILKSTFRLVPDESMQITQPEDIVLADTAYTDNPSASIRVSSEVVPFLPRVDVLLTGHACAPLGKRVPSQAVRLAIHRDGGWLLNKTLHVYGNRKGAAMAPFDRMPLVYERTYGGSGFAPNPYGTGMKPGSPYPNIVHPMDASAVAGFGPLSYEMRMARLVQTAQPRFIDEQVLDVPADFDDAYFQSAPGDQIVDSLQGQEWIEVDGMHPKHSRLVSRLPGISAVAKLYGVQPERPDGVRTISLRPDMLRIDADSLQCSVVFRAIIGIRDGRSLQTLRIAAGVETENVSVAHLLTAPPMRDVESPPEVGAQSAEFDDGSIMGQIGVNPQVSVINSRISISDEVTTEQPLEAIAAQNIEPARISRSDITMDDDTVTNDRPLTRAERERIATIAVQFGGKLPPPDAKSVRDEKPTLALDIDFSDLDSL